MLRINGVLAQLKKERQQIDQVLAVIESLKALPRYRSDRTRRLLKFAAEVERKSRHSR